MSFNDKRVFKTIVELLGELQQLKFQMSTISCLLRQWVTRTGNTGWVYGTDKCAKDPANNLVSETVYSIWPQVSEIKNIKYF